MGPDPNRALYLGIRGGDLDGKWYGKYYNADMVRLPDYALSALVVGPQATALCPALDDMRILTKPGYQPLETGYTLNPDGSMFIAGLTRFPKASPAMLDWWFWWHTRETARYKLWHPKAHVHAETDAPESPPGTPDRERYVGIVSYIDEYVGSVLANLRMHWLDPAMVGFDAGDLDPDYATAVCGRVGLSTAPIDTGYLIHYIRRVEDGAEMRVRLWMGGQYVAQRDDAVSFTAEQQQVLELMRQMNGANAHAVLAHCCQEMTHLASFLPEIYREFKSRGEG
jgi:hypothetical protein